MIGTDEESWQRLSRLLDDGDAEAVEAFLDALDDHDVAWTLDRLDAETRVHLMTLLPPERAARLLEELPEVSAVTALRELLPETAATILDEMPSAEQADLIGRLDDERANEILDRMDADEAHVARQLTRFSSDEAGGLMVTELLRYGESWTVGDVVADMRAHAEEYRDFQVQYAYVCDADGVLTGVLRLRDLLLEPHDRRVRELMIPDPVAVDVHTELDVLADLFDHHYYLGVPVIDERGRLAGVVLKSAVDEAWSDRQESDLLKVQGIVGGEELRSMPLMLRSRRRLVWLSLNILLNVVAASVIAVFQDTLSAVIALAVFLPIISDMSGCSGNQAVAVSMRELSLGVVRPEELLRVWFQEISVGLVNGLALGVLIGLVAWAWKGNPILGAVVGVALMLNTLVAVTIGGLVPLLLKRWKLDPAVASGPILTTMTDMCGFFLILSLATLVLDRLT